MSKLLKQFYDNQSEREAVKEFLLQALKELAVERVFDKQSVSGLYEGKKAIDKAFDLLEEMYGEKKIIHEVSSR